MRALATLILSAAGMVWSLPAHGMAPSLVFPDELGKYLASKDLVVRGKLLSAERRRDPADGRWVIVLQPEQTLKGSAAAAVTIFSLATPPPSVIGASVLAYASRTRSDKNRLWGNYFPIEVEGGRESVVVTDHAIPSNVVIINVDYRMLADWVRRTSPNPGTGERAIPYDDIVSLFGSRSAPRSH